MVAGREPARVDQCGARLRVVPQVAATSTRAAQSAVWLAITYKANFANFAAANGWIARAERLLEPLDAGPLHGWVLGRPGYRMPDLDAAEELTDGAARRWRSRPATSISSWSRCRSSG